MKRDHVLRSGLALTVLPLFAAGVIACGGGDEGSSTPPGGSSTSEPGAEGMNPSATPEDPSQTVSPTTPDDSEAPLVDDGTPLVPNEEEEPEPTGLIPPFGLSPLVPPFELGPPNDDRVGGTPNLFVDVLGRSAAEVDDKVRTAVNRFFGIGTADPAVPSVGDGGARSFYVLPQDPSMGFIWAADSNDIRSEGMSYGMFIAVQMDMKEQFDQLWRFAKSYMQYPSEPAAELQGWRLYFRWTGRVTPNGDEWTVEYNPTESPASDGEEYFAAALYLADRRWGSDGEIHYQAEADALTHAMLHNPTSAGRTALINAEASQVTFVPYGSSAEHSDPSYHLPAFYELFASDGPLLNRQRWRQIAEVSRDYFVRSAHPVTGLHPDYAQFDGTPTQGFQASNHDTFSFDAWRVPLNMAVDYAWTGPDERLRTQLDKYLSFFESRIASGNVNASGFNLDGTGASGGSSQALTATLAAATIGTSNASRTAFLNNLWNVPQPTGTYRYYQGSVYLLGLLAASGKLSYGFAQ